MCSKKTSNILHRASQLRSCRRTTCMRQHSPQALRPFMAVKTQGQDIGTIWRSTGRTAAIVALLIVRSTAAGSRLESSSPGGGSSRRGWSASEMMPKASVGAVALSVQAVLQGKETVGGGRCSWAGGVDGAGWRAGAAADMVCKGTNCTRISDASVAPMRRQNSTQY